MLARRFIFPAPLPGDLNADGTANSQDLDTFVRTGMKRSRSEISLAAMPPAKATRIEETLSSMWISAYSRLLFFPFLLIRPSFNPVRERLSET